MRSIARIIFSCGSDAAFIWNVTRDSPPSASLCRVIFAATSSGLPTSSAPCGPRCASKCSRRMTPQPRSLPMSFIARIQPGRKSATACSVVSAT